MAFSPLEPGLFEATKDALKALLIANLASLNTALKRDTLWDNLPDVNGDMVFLGDPFTLPPVELAPLWIAIFGSDSMIQSDQTNLDITDGAGYRYDLEINLRVYLHPKSFPNGTSPKAQEEKYERVLSRVTDWLLFGVCNTHAAKVLELASHVFGTAPDALLQTHIQRLNQDETFKSFGGSVLVPYVTFLFVGYIE